MIINKVKYTTHDPHVVRQISPELKVKRGEEQPSHKKLMQSWPLSNVKTGNIFDLRQIKHFLIQPSAVLMIFNPSLFRSSGLIQTAVTPLKIFIQRGIRTKPN